MERNPQQKDRNPNQDHKGGRKAMDRQDARHRLKCRHAQNSRVGRDYYMDCIIIKEMPGNRVKILVFGDRYWPGNDSKKRIRYVDKDRVRPK